MPFVRVKGINIHYELHCRGEPLLLLHGLGSSCLDWEYQLPALTPHFEVITPCLRGFGHTDKPPGPHSVMQYSADVLALLDHLGVERCQVLGFSMGGAIAFQTAVDAPGRFSSMIILNSLPSFEVDHWRKYLLVISRVGMANLMGMERMARYVAKRMFPEPEQASLRKKMLTRYRGNDKASYLAGIQALAGWSVKEKIHTIRAPVLVVAAEHDYSPVSDKEDYVSLLPQGRLEVIENSRHGTLFDQTETFNRLAVEFLLQNRSQIRRVG